MSKTIIAEHGRHVIKAGWLGGTWVARAFGTERGRTPGAFAEATGSSADEAIEALKEQLRDDHAAREAARRWDEDVGFAVPSRDEYVMALRQAKLSDAQIVMLRAHAAAGKAGLTAGEIARAAGYPNFETANVQYGKAAGSIGEAIGVAAPRSTVREGHALTGILARAGAPRPDTGQFVWVMHQELCEAVRETL